MWTNFGRGGEPLWSAATPTALREPTCGLRHVGGNIAECLAVRRYRGEKPPRPSGQVRRGDVVGIVPPRTRAERSRAKSVSTSPLKRNSAQRDVIKRTFRLPRVSCTRQINCIDTEARSSEKVAGSTAGGGESWSSSTLRSAASRLASASATGNSRDCWSRAATGCSTRSAGSASRSCRNASRGSSTRSST